MIKKILTSVLLGITVFIYTGCEGTTPIVAIKSIVAEKTIAQNTVIQKISKNLTFKESEVILHLVIKDLYIDNYCIPVTKITGTSRYGNFISTNIKCFKIKGNNIILTYYANNPEDIDKTTLREQNLKVNKYI